MDAIITAGGTPKPGKPLYEYTQGKPKAFLEINGKPLVQYALDAIGEAEHIERVVLVSVDEDSGVECKKPLAFVPHQGGMVENILAGTEKVLELNPDAEHVLIGVSDTPTYMPEMIDWAINEALKTHHDAYYYLVLRDVFEKRYPDSNRTYVWMKDVEVCGGTLGILATKLMTSDVDFWEKITAGRKSVWKQGLTFGISNLIKVLLRRLSVEQATTVLEERMGISGRAIFSPYAELAFDVDEDHELEYLRQLMTESG
ncbi:MAG: NTP transferase domain-containing protein [Chloroflexi bacterium]|nr:NTP transferase domain-containing protein [Chloroflexota bacterium]